MLAGLTIFSASVIISTMFWVWFYARDRRVDAKCNPFDKYATSPYAIPIKEVAPIKNICSCTLLKSIRDLLKNENIRQIEVSNEMLISSEVALPYQTIDGSEISFFKKSYVVDKSPFSADFKIELGDILFAYNEGDKIHLLPLIDGLIITEIADKFRM